MTDDSIRAIIRQKHLDLFLTAAEDSLPNLLKPIECLHGTEGFAVADYTSSPFAGFHPEAVRMVIKADDYYLSSRADHFVLIYGWSEAIDDFADCVVCLANHKGGLDVTVYGFVNQE